MSVVYLLNRSSNAHGIPDTEARRIAAALDHQATHEYANHWRSDVRCEFATTISTIPQKAPVVFILDRVSEYDPNVGDGVIGEHFFGPAGTGRPPVPWAVCGVRDALDQGPGWKLSEFVSHEFLEMVTRPRRDYLTITWLKTHSNPDQFTPQRLYPVEVCDPVQRSGYDVVLGSGLHVPVSNFVLPNWFQQDTANDANTDFMGHLSGPFTATYWGFFDLLDIHSAGPQNYEEMTGPVTGGNLGEHPQGEQLSRDLPHTAEGHSRGVSGPGPVQRAVPEG